MSRKLTPEQRHKARLLAAIEDLKVASFNTGDDHNDTVAAVGITTAQREIDRALKAYTGAVVKRASAAALDSDAVCRCGHDLMSAHANYGPRRCLIEHCSCNKFIKK